MIVVAVILLARDLRPRRLRSIVGSVVTLNPDPRKQASIADVEITAVDGDEVAKSRSDSSGFFQAASPNRDLARQDGKSEASTPGLRAPGHNRGAGRQDLRCPYGTAPGRGTRGGERAGGVAVRSSREICDEKPDGRECREHGKVFEVPNTGNVPCNQSRPCSPDGKWKAAARGESFDAGEGHEFRNPRVSCIAGPCPFARIGPQTLTGNGRKLNVDVLNWSDTTTFLFEAEVIQARAGDAVHQLYPAIFGRNMSFTLPATAQGPSIEAELNGLAVVFPLGPSLGLSWAACNLQITPDKTKRYTCELKPGYNFR